MIKEKYEKPIMEVVNLDDDVILTSGGSSSCYPVQCGSDGIACVAKLDDKAGCVGNYTC